MAPEERALEDVVEETIVLGLSHLEERLRREDTCIVEQHVETAESVDCGLHEGLTGRRKGDVADMRDSTLARGIDLMGGCFGLGGITAVDDDRAALGDEPGRDLLAHPRTTPGDDGNLVPETHDLSPLLYLSIDR